MMIIQNQTYPHWLSAALTSTISVSSDRAHLPPCCRIFFRSGSLANHARIGLLYLTTLASPTPSSLLEAALASLLAALASEDGTLPKPVWQMRYEQAAPNDNTGASNDSETGLFTFAPAAPELAFKDTLLEPVKDAWRTVLGTEVTPEMEEAYLKFEDREGVADDDES